MNLQRNLNALIIIIIAGTLLSAFGVQFLYREEPCPLCLLQRLGMIGVACACLMNVWYGIRPAHYGLALLSALFGGFVALRQISLHVCPGFSEFGFPVLGLSLYTWSFIVFACVVLAVALLLFLYKPEDSHKEVGPVNSLANTALYLILFVALANIITAFAQCGLGPCND